MLALFFLYLLRVLGSKLKSLYASHGSCIILCCFVIGSRRCNPSNNISRKPESQTDLDGLTAKMQAPLVLHPVSIIDHVSNFANDPRQVNSSNGPKREKQMRAQGDGQPVFPALPTSKPTFYRVGRSTSVGSAETPAEARIRNSPQGSGISNNSHSSGWGATKRDVIVSKWRKASIPELRSSPMTTVQEISLDSRKDICAAAAADNCA